MKILAVDSSAAAASAAVLDGQKVLAENYLNIGLTHSQTLLPLIDAALKSAGVTMEQIELLAVTNGPARSPACASALPRLKGLRRQKTYRASACLLLKPWLGIFRAFPQQSARLWTPAAVRFITRCLRATARA